MMKIIALAILHILLPYCAFAQTITTIAGNGIVGNTGDGGLAIYAQINYPVGGTFDKQGNFYFATSNTGNSIRKITPTGVISTVTGTGEPGFSGDNGPAISAKLNRPQAVAVDTADNLYIADAGNNRIRKVNATTGVIETIAGNGIGAYGGDGGLSTAASIFNPLDVCFDKTGNLYIADNGSGRVRKINTLGIISTVVGNGTIYNSVGGGLADTTPILGPSGLCTDDSGNLYIANWHSRVYKVNTLGIIKTIVGNGIPGSNGDGGIATNAQSIPCKITIDDKGNIYIAERDMNKIRLVNKTGIISTIVGNGVGSSSGDGDLAVNAHINQPSAVTLDTCNNLFIADSHNYRIRKVTFNPDCKAVAVKDVEKTSSTSLRLYPNPAHTQLTISTTDPITNLCITNVLGQVVTAPPGLPQGEVTVPVGHLPKGVYVVRVNGVYVQRFVKE